MDCIASIQFSVETVRFDLYHPVQDICGQLKYKAVPLHHVVILLIYVVQTVKLLKCLTYSHHIVYLHQ